PTLLLTLVFAWFLQPQSPRSSGDNRIGHLVRQKDFLFIYFANFASLFAFWNIVSWGPAFFETERGMGLGAAGFYTALISLGGIPAGLLLGRLSDRVGRKKIAIMLLPVAALSLVIITRVYSNFWLLVILVLYGATGKLAWEPIVVSWIGDLVAESYPGSMGSALSLFGTIGMSSAVVAPVLAGWIRDLTGSLQGSFYLSAGMLVLGAFCLLIPRETSTVSEAAVPFVK
ncbi:MAG: MFS transporter, partial [Chloroflexi bacterium]|nr:MFS transporter [Chloroflexota bacterium]